MDDTDKKLLSLMQAEVPIVARPWARLGARLGIAEEEVMRRVQALKSTGVIRQISAIFDTRALGYQSSLVAVRCDPLRVDAAAAVINEHPGVSHNYLRHHPYNLWYTIAVGPTSRLGLERTVEVLHALSGAQAFRLLPALHVFKIGVELDVEETDRTDAKADIRFSERNRGPEEPLTEREKLYIREMQRDLPVELEPFTAIARRLGVSLEQLQLIGEAMLLVGKMRRYAAVLNHRRAGFTANALGVWTVPGSDAEILAAGEKMAAFKAVSHCYRRPTYPDWPYNIFTMVHGRTTADCDAVLAGISRETGLTHYAALYSTRQYKKTRVEYFSEAEADWEARHGA